MKPDHPLRTFLSILAGEARTALHEMVRHTLEQYAETLEYKTIGRGGSTFAVKYKVFDCALKGGKITEDTAHPADDDENDRRLFVVRLHRFYRGDADVELHNHPWRLGVGIILLNGYVEERLAPLGSYIGRIFRGDFIRERELSPGSIIVTWPWTFHRIDRIRSGTGESWTLFIHGPNARAWGFRVNGDFVPSKAFEALKGAGRAAQQDSQP